MNLRISRSKFRSARFSFFSSFFIVITVASFVKQIIMPTILLIDSSLSLSRPISSLFDVQNSNGDVITRKEQIHKGLSFFLDIIAERHPFELISIMTFSSSSTIHMPFSRDFEALKSSLREIKLKDRTCIDIGLRSSFFHASSSYGSDSVVQVITIIDTRSGGTQNLLDLELPIFVKLHIIAYGIASESDSMIFDTICKKTSGSFQSVELSVNFQPLKSAFESIINTHYAVYSGTLAYGYCNSPINLFPNPNTSLFSRRISQQGSRTSLPSSLSICGFLPNKKMPSPPGISRHILLPSSSSNSSSSSLCIVLNDCLKAERMSALVLIDKRDWYGLITSIIDKDKSRTTGLIFTIFMPGFRIPWIGEFSRLSTISAMQSESASAIVLPIKSTRTKSYHSKSQAANSITHTNQEVLQKVIRYCRDLPRKVYPLFSECEKLCAYSQLHYIPSIRANLALVIDQEIRKDTPSEIVELLEELVDQIRGNRQIQAPEIEHSVGRSNSHHISPPKTAAMSNIKKNCHFKKIRS